MTPEENRAKFMENIVAALKQNPSERKLYLAMTGGGTRAISKLLESGGASGVFLGASVPYDTDDLRNLVGSFDKAVSKQVAKVLSGTGFKQESALNIEKEYGGVCVSCTCSLRKNGVERAGREHIAWFAVSSYNKDESYCISTLEVKLTKDRTREEEEELVANIILCLAVNNVTLSKWHISTLAKAQEILGLVEGEVGDVSFNTKPVKKEKKEEKEVIES